VFMIATSPCDELDIDSGELFRSFQQTDVRTRAKSFSFTPSFSPVFSGRNCREPFQRLPCADVTTRFQQRFPHAEAE
jgi:hypothetical protein